MGPAGALFREGAGAAAAAVVGGSVVGAVALAVPAVTGAGLRPGLGLVLALGAGWLPAAAVGGLLAGALVGGRAAGESFRAQGAFVALQAAGRAPQRLWAAVGLCGLLWAAAVAGLTHVAEPAGRRQAAAALAGRAAAPALRPGVPVAFGDGLVRVDGLGPDGGWRGVVAAVGPVVLGVPAATDAPGGLRLGPGSAWVLPAGTGAPWSLRFAGGTVGWPQPRVDAGFVADDTPALRARVARGAAAGRDMSRAAVHLARRSALPLCAPILLFLGLGAGARGWRPAPVVLLVGAGGWALLRLGDAVAVAVGPVLAAALLPVGLGLGAWRVWGRGP